jgi:tetratricopeptide (TPR) repeat protein
MKVQLTILLAWLLAFGAVAQSVQLAHSGHSPDTNVSKPRPLTLAERHVLPLFGEVSKTSAQIDEEIRFLSDCDKMFGSRNEASQFFASRGWEYLQEGQLDTAIYRFNLAYLLNDKNIDSYWGLGVICYQKENLSDAERMLRKGVDLSPDNVALLVDLSTVELKHYALVSEAEDLNEADQVLQHAVVLDSTYAQTHYNLSLVEYYRGNFDKSWEYLHNGRKLNFSLINLQFVDLLREKLADPQGFFK